MIRQSVPPAARAAFLAGVHRDDHTYRMALYAADADLGNTTARYDPRAEVTGRGYIAGGQAIKDWRVVEDATGAYIDLGPIVWPAATIKAAGALIYNDSAPGKPVVAVLPFAREVVSTDAPFVVRLEGKLVRI